jgi:hypothetical protein
MNNSQAGGNVEIGSHRRTPRIDLPLASANGFNDRIETCYPRHRRRVNDKISPDCQTLRGQIIWNGHNAHSDGRCGLAQ